MNFEEIVILGPGIIAGDVVKVLEGAPKLCEISLEFLKFLQNSDEVCELGEIVKLSSEFRGCIGKHGTWKF
jgi:hypothetical protein